MSELSQHAIECIAEAEAERDELAELLRRFIEPDFCGLNEHWRSEVRAALAKLDPPPCERCEGTRKVGSDCGAFVEACPGCACKSCDLGTIYGDDGSAKPCPDCTEAGA